MKGNAKIMFKHTVQELTSIVFQIEKKQQRGILAAVHHWDLSKSHS